MKYFVFVLTLWSCNFAFSVPHSPWQFVQEQGKKECEKNIVENMPRVRSQDSLPICGPMASATVAQFQVCKSLNIANCSRVDRKQEVSPFSTLAWTHTNTGRGVPELQNHENIQVYGKTKGAAGDALRNAKKDALFVSDSCYPLDQFANEYEVTGDPNVNAENEIKVQDIFDRINTDYNRYQSRNKTEGEFCEECEGMGGAVSKLRIATSANDIKKHMNSSKGLNSAQFLYNLMLGSCDDGVAIEPAPKFEMFPKGYEQEKKKAQKIGSKEVQNFNYNALVGKIKSVLKTKNPLAFDGVCLKYEGDKCVTGHSVVISGYRKVCKDSACGTECRDVLKVQNSWGEDWQKRNNDGWVDARALLSYVTEDPSRMENVLSWYH